MPSRTNIEAGIALTGTEVKSLRFGEGSIAESYAEVKDGEVWLVNANIPEFSHGNRFNHEPKRPRKLLLHAREIEQDVRRGGAAGHDAGAAVHLFQRPRPGEGRARHGQGQARRTTSASIEKEKDWKKEQGRLLRQHG